MVVLEAWAYGKPVLMTPESNLSVGFTRNAAIRIEPEVESIAQGLKQLFNATSPSLFSQGSNGRQLVREQFAWPVVGQETARLYEWVLGGGNKPGSVVSGE